MQHPVGAITTIEQLDTLIAKNKVERVKLWSVAKNRWHFFLTDTTIVRYVSNWDETVLSDVYNPHVFKTEDLNISCRNIEGCVTYTPTSIYLFDNAVYAYLWQQRCLRGDHGRS